MSEFNCNINLKYKYGNAESGLGLTFFYSGMEQCAPGHYWMGIRDHYYIHFILSGRGRCSYGEDVYELGGGQSFLTKPMQRVHYKADKKDPWKYCWVAFSGVQAKTLVEYTGFGSENHITGFSNIKEVERAMEKLENIDVSQPNQYALILSHLLFLISCLDTNKEYEKYKSGIKGRHFDVARNFIDKNYSRNIKIEDVAKHAGVNRKYLNEIFKEHLNVTTQKFLLDKRMGQAAVLLGNTSLSIKEIAYSVGYRDALLFSKMFKRKYGISPNGFRERIKKGEDYG